MNLRGLFGDCKECKLDSLEMRQVINSCDIMFFFQTMNSKQFNVLYEGYEVSNVIGVKFHKNGRASGGFMVCMKREHFQFLKVIFSKTKYWIWVEITVNSGDITNVGFVYMPPKNQVSIKEEIFHYSTSYKKKYQS